MKQRYVVALAVLLAASVLFANAGSAGAASATATPAAGARATATKTQPASKAAATAKAVGKTTARATATKSPTKTAPPTATKIAPRALNKTATRAPQATATKLRTLAQPTATAVSAAPATAVPVPTRTAVVRPTARPVRTSAPAPTQTAVPSSPAAQPTAPPTTAVPPVGDAPQLILRADGIVPGYDRSAWKHWGDSDRDCQDTRAEVLIAESLEPVTFTSSNNCTVLGGRWYDAYTNTIFTVAHDLDVDHFVPLSNAHSSGGTGWAPDRRQDYANSLADADHLIAVSASANRSKGNRAPDAWKPPNQGYWCEYAYDWIRIKYAWGLSATQSEWAALQSMIATCPVGFTYANAAGSVVVAVIPPAPAATVVVVPATAQPAATAVIVVVPTDVPVAATAVVVVVPTDVPVAATGVVVVEPTAAPTAVPTVAPAATAVAAGQCAPGQIDVNSATLDDLQRIKHIGAARAQALITLRPFSSVNDLARISGIGSGVRLAEIKAENLACVN